jgi:hypothetical protein
MRIKTVAFVALYISLNTVVGYGALGVGKSVLAQIPADTVTAPNWHIN